MPPVELPAELAAATERLAAPGARAERRERAGPCALGGARRAVCARPGCCAPARPPGSVRCRPRPRSRSRARSGSRAATPPPAGACRSPAPPACWPAGCPSRGRPRCWAPPTTWPPACGPRAVARRPSTAGLRVSGRWAFCSGISHSNWLFAGCVLENGEGAAPQLRVVALPTASSRSSTRGTPAGCARPASNDAVADELFVPAERVLSLLGAEPRLDERLYRFPAFGYFALSIAAAALGNARGAIDELIELAPARSGLGAARTLAERPATQARRRRGRGEPAGRPGALLRGHRGGLVGGCTRARSSGVAAPRPAARRHPRRAHLGRGRARDVRPRRGQRDLRALARCSGASATPTPPPPTSRSACRRGS